MMARNTAHGTGALPDTTPMRWNDPANADKREWMLANAGKQHSIPEVVDMFEAEFGIRLKRTQVSLFRSQHGMQSRRNCKGRADRLAPIGTERLSKGYTIVKVRESPTVPISKDNWVLKQRWVWEQSHGTPVPPNHNVLFGDGDRTNFDPDNLVAVPTSKMRRLNSGRYEWHNADELRVVLAFVELESAVARMDAARPRVCEVCGREFVPDLFESKSGEVKSYAVNAHTCRDCLDRGFKAKGEPKVSYERTCAVCGRKFTAHKKSQRRCPECIGRKPKHSAERQSAVEGGER